MSTLYLAWVHVCSKDNNVWYLWCHMTFIFIAMIGLLIVSLLGAAFNIRQWLIEVGLFNGLLIISIWLITWLSHDFYCIHVVYVSMYLIHAIVKVAWIFYLNTFWHNRNCLAWVNKIVSKMQSSNHLIIFDNCIFRYSYNYTHIV